MFLPVTAGTVLESPCRVIHFRENIKIRKKITMMPKPTRILNQSGRRVIYLIMQGFLFGDAIY
jgi:hypothetical protein